VGNESYGDHFVFEDAESEFVSEAVGGGEGGDAGWGEAVDYHCHARGVSGGGWFVVG